MINYEHYVLNPKQLNKIKRFDWLELWINKVDYITDYYNQIKGMYRIIDDSINYYVAMIEASIYYLKEFTNYYDYSFIQHKIIFYDHFFNSNYFKEDLKERDIAEYIKYLFFMDNYDVNNLYSLIEKSINKFNYELVIARLLFPSYYLYYLERVMIDNADYDILESIVNRSKEYEDYLKKIVNKVNQYLAKKIVLPF